MALDFQVEMRKLSFGFYASTISYKCLNKVPFFPNGERYHHSSMPLNETVEWTLA